VTLPILDDALQARLRALCAEGWEFFDRFDRTVRERGFHAFVASDYELVQAALAAHRAPGLRFLELGSASGVITIMADLMGYEACGIELDHSLVAIAREMAARYASRARFVAGSFFPAGYVYRARSGDLRTGTLGEGASGYMELSRSLDDFDVVFGYPWGGEEPVLLDLMSRFGNPDALLLMHSVHHGVQAYRGGRLVGPVG
jgi:peptidoglycan/xylan/chitin deacetylase (PgdA/CDA1 family)